MRTSAMAEGGIEGDAAVYEVPSAFATAFAFSRFDPAPEGPPIADDGLEGMLGYAQSDDVDL